MTELQPPVGHTAPIGGVGDALTRAVAPLGRALDPIGRWLTLGGIGAYFLATLTDREQFRTIGSSTLVSLVALVALVAAIVDVARPSLAAGAIAHVGSVTFLGRALLAWPSDSWWGNGAMHLLLTVADIVLVVGFLAFTGRAAGDRRDSPATQRFEAMMLSAVGAMAVLVVFTYRDLLSERYAIYAILIWFVHLGLIAAATLTRSPAGLITGGVGAAVHAIALFSPILLLEGVEQRLAQLVLAVIAGLSAHELAQLRTAPLSPAPIQYDGAPPSVSGAPPSVSRAPSTVSGTLPPAPSLPGVSSAPAMSAPTDYASFGARLGAAIVDGLVFSISTVLLYSLLIAAIAQESAGILVLAFTVPIALDVVLLVWYCRRTARTGQSWGKSATGIYLVKSSTGRPMTAWGVFGRGVASWISTLPCYLGYFWMLWDPARQTWHDKIAGTVVVRSMPSAQPTLPVTFGGAASGVTAGGVPAAVESLAPPATAEAAPEARAQGVVPDSDLERTIQRPPSGGARLELRDGRQIRLESHLLIGRDPSPAPGEPAGALLAIADDLMISKTHLAIGSDDPSTIWVEDRHSTNGVTVRRDGVVLVVPAGQRFPLRDGDRVHFGEHWVTAFLS